MTNRIPAWYQRHLDRLYARSLDLYRFSRTPVRDYGYCGPDDIEAMERAEARREALETFREWRDLRATLLACYA